MKYIYFLLITLIFFACKEPKQQITLPEKSEIVGVASPIILNADSTVIYLQDYFPSISAIDSVSVPQYFDYDYDEDDKLLIIKSLQKNMPKLSELKVWAKGFPYSIILRKPKRINYIFSCELDTTRVQVKTIIRQPKGRRKKPQIIVTQSSKSPEARIFGDFNGWNKTGILLRQNGTSFETSLPLSAGKYNYKILFNDKERTDPSNKDSVLNGKNGYVSVLTVSGSDETKLPKLFTQNTDNQTVTIGASNVPSEIFALWENFRVAVKEENGLYQIKIPVQAGQNERSCLRVFAQNAEGESNDLLIPLRNGKIIIDAAELTRTDRHADILYFLPVDKFLDGDTLSNVRQMPQANAAPKTIIIKGKRGKRRTIVVAPTPVKTIIAPKGNYCGDMQGILRKLEEGYFSKLGVNTLWVSPIIQQNQAAAAPNFVTVRRGKKRILIARPQIQSKNSKFDYKIGNEFVLQEIVKEAHKQNINVLLDLVLNAPPATATPATAAKSFPAEPKPRKIKKRHKRRESSVFMTIQYTPFSMAQYSPPNLSQTDVVKAMTDSVVFWIKKFDLDGFRHDTLTLNNGEFLRALTHKLKRKIVIPQKKILYQIGESRNSREIIASYIGTGLQDSQLDFPLFADARSVFANDTVSFSRLANSLKISLSCFGNHHLMVNAVEKQGFPRFISLGSGALILPPEKPQNTLIYAKLLQFHAFEATIPGVPSIFLGDEIGRKETDDATQGMKFENLTPDEKNVKNITEKLLKIRRTNMPLLFGDFDVIQSTDRTLAYSRSYFDKTIAVFFNKGNVETTIVMNLPNHVNTAALKAQFGNRLTIDGQQISVTVPPNGFEILGSF
jgi:cyclomaltodextrinase / maltogenic alpha-amylase / neopullulanase